MRYLVVALLVVPTLAFADPVKISDTQYKVVNSVDVIIDMDAEKKALEGEIKDLAEMDKEAAKIATYYASQHVYRTRLISEHQAKFDAGISVGAKPTPVLVAPVEEEQPENP